MDKVNPVFAPPENVNGAIIGQALETYTPKVDGGERMRDGEVTWRTAAR